MLSSSLDFEESRSHVFTVTADDGVFSDTAVVRITVVDVNDHTPRFGQDNYVIEINEGNYSSDSNPQNLVRVMAMDDDSDVLGRIQYDIFPANPLFAVHNSSGWVSVVGDVDRETQTSHSITILARDGGKDVLNITCRQY